MNETISSEQRYSIFVNAFMAYLATLSESYAESKAVATGERLDVESLRAAEIGRDACDVCRREISVFCAELGEHSEEFARRYLSRFQTRGRNGAGNRFKDLMILAEDYNGEDD